MTQRHSETILILGATSDIARQIAICFASAGYSLILAARDQQELAVIAADLVVRFATPVKQILFDADRDQPQVWIHSSMRLAGNVLAGMVVGIGLYAREERVAQQPALADRMDHINHRVPAALVKAALRHISPAGFVCVISSVAGDRVRPSLASYARSKALLNLQMQTLRRQHPDQRPLIVTAKPGPTLTRMTWGHASPAAADPQHIAADIVHAIRLRRSVVYTPARWRWIMRIIRLIPGPLFRRLFRRI